MPLTRRSLLSVAAKIGGAGAVYETLAAWEFLKPPAARAAALELPADSGRGKTVAILGAGVAGLCAAYELDRAGYDCIILEAAHRPGGRSLTLRRGDTFKEVGDFAAQTVTFDEGLYYNAGPSRIPHHHVHIIEYCRQFGVALQPYIFANRANLVHTGHIGNGKTYPVRQVYHDLQGHVAELLDKCMSRQDAELPVTRAQLEAFRDMLSKFGDLTKIGGEETRYVYRNKYGRAGYETPPGLPNEPGRPLSPLALDELLRSRVWDDFIFRDAEFFWQATLLEPVGGMDRFFRGFLSQPLTRGGGTIASLVRYGAFADSIEVAADNVTVAYKDGGVTRALAADYCISTIPIPIFRNLNTNLSTAYMDAARKMPTHAAGRVGWQAERFWERKDQIYGGISWTTDTITQIWYPSSGFMSQNGILLGAYMYGDKAEKFNALPVAERLQLAKDQGEKLHVGFSDAVGHGVAVGWNNMELARMGWTDEADPNFGALAQALSTPQGRFHMAGDQLTYWSGWQEGAVISALEAVKSIDRETRPTSAR